MNTEDSSKDAFDIGSISNGSYTYYNSINFTDMRTFRTRVASVGSDGNIEAKPLQVEQPPPLPVN